MNIRFCLRRGGMTNTFGILITNPSFVAGYNTMKKSLPLLPLKQLHIHINGAQSPSILTHTAFSFFVNHFNCLDTLACWLTPIDMVSSPSVYQEPLSRNASYLNLWRFFLLHYRACPRRRNHHWNVGATHDAFFHLKLHHRKFLRVFSMRLSWMFFEL